MVLTLFLHWTKDQYLLLLSLLKVPLLIPHLHFLLHPIVLVSSFSFPLRLSSLVQALSIAFKWVFEEELVVLEALQWLQHYPLLLVTQEEVISFQEEVLSFDKTKGTPYEHLTNNTSLQNHLQPCSLNSWHSRFQTIQPQKAQFFNLQQGDYLVDVQAHILA